MKTTITHLPPNKQHELAQIVSIIQRFCDDIDRIILFGSYARGDWREEQDLAPHRKSGYKSDYDIFVVTQKKATAHNGMIWHQITQACFALKQSTHARIIAHDIEYLNIKLRQGQYFFSDIKKEGCLLYNSGQSELAEQQELTLSEQKRVAQDQFDYWFENANSFYKCFKNALAEEDYNIAAFQLHQAAESAYKSILIVFTNYIPHEHYLQILSKLAIKENEQFKDIFPLDEKIDQERFEMLDYAYIGGRYDPEFRVFKMDLDILSPQVETLLVLTGEICQTKIDRLVEGESDRLTGRLRAKECEDN